MKDDLPYDFKAFYHTLGSEERERFANAAATTTNYIECHLVYARKTPRPARMNMLYAACVEFGARFSHEDLLKFFYPDLLEKPAAALFEEK